MKETELYLKIKQYIDIRTIRIMSKLLESWVRIEQITLTKALIRLNEDYDFPIELTIDLAEMLSAQDADAKIAKFEAKLGERVDRRNPHTMPIRVWVNVLEILIRLEQRKIADGLIVLLDSISVENSSWLYNNEGTPYENARRALGPLRL